MLKRQHRDAREENIRELWISHAGAVYTYAARRVGVERASNVVSETFRLAWRRQAAEEGLGLPWLYGVARNHIRRTNRSAARYDRLCAALPVADDEVSAESLALSRLAIGEALASMTGLDAEILLLSAWEGLSSSEIAKVVDLNPAAVRMRLTRAKRVLRTRSNQNERKSNEA